MFLSSTVAHRCHGNIWQHRRDLLNIKWQHAATYAFGLHGHFKSSRQHLESHGNFKYPRQLLVKSHGNI